MSQKKKFKEVRQQMQEITKRKPTSKQLDDLKKTFLEIEQAEKEKAQKDPTDTPVRKIARDAEMGM